MIGHFGLLKDSLLMALFLNRDLRTEEVFKITRKQGTNENVLGTKVCTGSLLSSRQLSLLQGP